MIRMPLAIADLPGTDPQLKGPLNCVPSGSQAAAYFAVRVLTDATIPTNGGCFRPVTLKLPKGSLVNPEEPAPVSASNPAMPAELVATKVSSIRRRYSSAVAGLIERYTEAAPDVRIIAYRNGYAGLLTGDSVEVTDEVAGAGVGRVGRRGFLGRRVVGRGVVCRRGRGPGHQLVDQAAPGADQRQRLHRCSR